MDKIDLIFHVENQEYIIRNVPYEQFDDEDEKYFFLDVSIKVTAIRDLMVRKEISNEIDFDDVADIEF